MQREQIIDYVVDTLERWTREGTHWMPKPSARTTTTPTETITAPPVAKEAAPKKTEYAAIAGDPVPAANAAGPTNDSIAKITTDLHDCQRCKLSKGRTNIVIGRGNPKAELMFIGEAPGRDEDIQGQPFVGRAGKLLDKIIAAMGFDREEIYIANIVKCRPPENRAPEPDEIKSCSPFLKRQIDIINPKVICTLGGYAAQTLLTTEERISTLRGQFRELNGRPVMPTYHPAFLLRNPEMKKFVWEDVQKICKRLGREPVGKGN